VSVGFSGYNPAMKPLIGITVDRVNPPDDTACRYQIGEPMARAVAEAGGVPVLMPADPALAADLAARLDGVALSGGLDPDTTGFGEPMHPKARRMDPARQAFELALLDELAKYPGKPVLGICLGMQMMTLHAGGELNQYMPETHERPEAHQDGADHPIRVVVDDAVITPGDADEHEPIYSSHQQAVSNTGKMRVIATAHDGTIEAVDGRPIDAGRFYVGVQWHPERGGGGPLNLGLFRQLVAAASGPA